MKNTKFQYQHPHRKGQWTDMKEDELHWFKNVKGYPTREIETNPPVSKEEGNTLDNLLDSTAQNFGYDSFYHAVGTEIYSDILGIVKNSAQLYADQQLSSKKDDFIDLFDYETTYTKHDIIKSLNALYPKSK